MTNAIELNHISKSFGEFSLKNVTLAIPAGTICGLVGENGAGKSTLIRILMGALRPDSGTAAALGVDVSAPEFLNAKEDIGVVLDEGCFPETLTAPQVGRVMAATYRRWEQDTFDAYCRRFALPEKTAFKDYSRGMKMKLTIAGLLYTSPPLHGRQTAPPRREPACSGHSHPETGASAPSAGGIGPSVRSGP